MTDNRLEDLAADLIPVAQQWQMDANRAVAPSKAVITVTFRGPGDQNTAQAQNLSKACWGASPHNCMLDGKPAARAFDFAIIAPDGTYVKNGADPRYTIAARCGIKLGLAWGGNWTHVKPDYDHLEIPDWKNAVLY